MDIDDGDHDLIDQLFGGGLPRRGNANRNFRRLLWDHRNNLLSFEDKNAAQNKIIPRAPLFSSLFIPENFKYTNFAATITELE